MSAGSKATAFMSKQRKWIANVRLIMSAFADQNHAPSLTCVRLEWRG